MKALVLYSSETGRTKKLAEAVRSVLPANTDFLPMEQAPERFDDYDIVFVGVWFLNLKLDKKSRAVLPFLKAKKVASLLPCTVTYSRTISRRICVRPSNFCRKASGSPARTSPMSTKVWQSFP